MKMKMMLYTFLPQHLRGPNYPRRQSRPRKSNPPLPKTREVVIALPCPQQQELFTRNKGKEKMADVKGKGKGKLE
jgi:hypothetical protein